VIEMFAWPRMSLTSHTTARVLEALGLSWSDLFPPRLEEEPDPEAVYTYEALDGMPLFQVVRYPGKKFLQRRWDGAGAWAWHLDACDDRSACRSGEHARLTTPVRRVLYRLPRVMRAIGDGETIYVVEGERDVHTMEALGFTATCNPGRAAELGKASKWRDEDHSLWLGAADVVIIANNDRAGWNHAFSVARRLHELDIPIRLVDVLPGVNDVSELRSAVRNDELTRAHALRPGGPASHDLDDWSHV
jgi:putative DNA primase/helicase